MKLFGPRSVAEQSSILVFVHVPKAAGSTLRRILDDRYGEHAVRRCDMHLFPSAFEGLRTLPPDLTRNMRCLIGHLPYGIHKYLPRPARYVTILRNPVDRFLSKYAYLRNKKWVAEQLGVDQKQIESLEAFIDLQAQRNAMNFQTRQISGRVDFLAPMPPFEEPMLADALETAKENLKNEFAVVGLQDRFNESLLLMKREFGWGNVCYLKQRVTSRPVPRNSVSPQTRALIERHNELDMQLFEFATKRFAEQVEAYGPSFNSDLQAFERRNERYLRRNQLMQKVRGFVSSIAKRPAQEQLAKTGR